MLCVMLQSHPFHFFLLNICLRPLSEVTHQYGIKYHQYADHTQLCISPPAGEQLLLRFCISVCRLNYRWGKTGSYSILERLNVCGFGGHPNLIFLLFLILDGVALYQISLGLILDSWLLLKDQVTDVAKRIFTQIHLVHQLC